jgi:hypothetical protein
MQNAATPQTISALRGERPTANAGVRTFNPAAGVQGAPVAMRPMQPGGGMAFNPGVLQNQPYRPPQAQAGTGAGGLGDIPGFTFNSQTGQYERAGGDIWERLRGQTQAYSPADAMRMYTMESQNTGGAPQMGW